MRASAALSSAPAGGAEDEGVMEAFIAAYRKARKLLQEGLDSGDAETLHEARKFVIHHLHHLRLMWPEGERRLFELEALREMLGDLNDLDELEQLAAGAAAAGEDARRMRKARRRLLRKAERAAHRLFRERPATWRKRVGHAGSRHSPAGPGALQPGQ